MRQGAVGRAADDKNSYRPLRCERTEATVAAIFAPLLKVGVMTDISRGFMTNVQSLFRYYSRNTCFRDLSRFRKRVQLPVWIRFPNSCAY
jgi:hypothetical protein